MSVTRYTSSDGVEILIVTCRYTQEFYQPIAAVFEKTAKEQIFPAALRAYEASDDRRKRYRFPTWRADFCALAHQDYTEFSLSLNGAVLCRERHLFEDQILLKRKRFDDDL